MALFCYYKNFIKKKKKRKKKLHKAENKNLNEAVNTLEHGIWGNQDVCSQATVDPVWL